MHFHRFRQSLSIVSAFKAAHEAARGVAACNIENSSCEGAEVLGFQAERPYGVFRMGVEAGAEEHQLGLDAIRGRCQGGREAGKILLAAHAEAQRDIEREAQPASRSGFLLAPRARVERIAMYAVKENLRVGIEDVLRPITMVYVPVHDKNAFELVPLPRPLRRQCNIIEQAETHAAERRGVMPGRPHQAERGGVLAFKHCINRRATRPCRP